jgi:hypothetical protein
MKLIELKRPIPENGFVLEGDIVSANALKSSVLRPTARGIRPWD